jgi:autoinducer 2-degrading protein
MQILWLDRAEADIDELFDYLIERNPQAARRIYDAIRDQVALLADQPGLGRPGRITGTPELVITPTPYIVAYSVDRDANAVILLRVLHRAPLARRTVTTPIGIAAIDCPLTQVLLHGHKRGDAATAARSNREESGMLAMWVKVRVKPELRKRFLEAIEVDALGSERDEPGCYRFNVLQDMGDENVYYFYEVYKDQAALEAHRAMPHYEVWRSAADTLDGPAEATRCQTVFPADEAYWSGGSRE